MKKMRTTDSLRALGAMIYGTLLYVPLTLLPLAGPFYAGMQAGKKAKTGPVMGFFAGIISAVAGYLFWVTVLFPFLGIRPDNILSDIFWIAFLGWNVLCAFISGIGGMMGSMLSFTESNFKAYGKNADRPGPEEADLTEEHNNSAPTFIICPSCGTSNEEKAKQCKSCGKEI